MLEMDHTVVEDVVLDTHEQDQNMDWDSEDVLEEPGANFTESEYYMNDDDFLYDRNDPDRITVGPNSDTIMEEQHIDAIGEDTDSDHSYDPTAKELTLITYLSRRVL
ncbi:Uncharacterized protein Adt_28627 [Abeliophyllum distichum]|uniref:Uncharacterized protein n=1 Tax=Abeliophyllum distichum TaxID=126358 RepID=A0ABD1S1B5_9LAMI